MDNLTKFDTFVHDRERSHNLNYLKHGVIPLLHIVYSACIVNNISIHIFLWGNFLH